MPRGRRDRWICRLGFVASAAVVACATGGSSSIPRGAPRLAEGSTPEPVRYEVVVAGPRSVVRLRVARVLNDSLFHLNGGDAASVTAYNLARLTKVRVEVVPAGKDSMRVALTGETYMGDTTRLDSISGLPERWRLISAGDPEATLLRGLARALRARAVRPPELGGPPVAPSGGSATAPAGGAPGSVGAALPPTTAAPGAGSVAPPLRTSVDSTPGAVLAATPVGRAVNVCRTTIVPPGWLILYWYIDTRRCTALPDQRYRGEPNAMRLEREW